MPGLFDISQAQTKLSCSCVAGSFVAALALAGLRFTVAGFAFVPGFFLAAGFCTGSICGESPRLPCSGAGSTTFTSTTESSAGFLAGSAGSSAGSAGSLTLPSHSSVSFFCSSTGTPSFAFSSEISCSAAASFFFSLLFSICGAFFRPVYFLK